jgi:hypothetical protein
MSYQLHQSVSVSKLNINWQGSRAWSVPCYGIDNPKCLTAHNTPVCNSTVCWADPINHLVYIYSTHYFRFHFYDKTWSYQDWPIRKPLGCVCFEVVWCMLIDGSVTGLRRVRRTAKSKAALRCQFLQLLYSRNLTPGLQLSELFYRGLPNGRGSSMDPLIIILKLISSNDCI